MERFRLSESGMIGLNKANSAIHNNSWDNRCFWDLWQLAYLFGSSFCQIFLHCVYSKRNKHMAGPVYSRALRGGRSRAASRSLIHHLDPSLVGRFRSGLKGICCRNLQLFQSSTKFRESSPFIIHSPHGSLDNEA